MIITKNKRFLKKYVVGGAGIFDVLGNLFGKQLASTALSAGKTAAKTAAKEIGKKAVDVGKSVAFDAGKQLTTKLLTSKNRPVELTRKSKDTLSRIINEDAENAVDIQDLVRRINGAGVKVVKK